MNVTVVTEGVLVVVLCTNFLILGAGRIRTCVFMMALQGAAIGLLPILAHDVALRSGILAAAIVAIKAGVFPRVLLRVLRDVSARREVEPFVGTTLSVMAGAGAFLFSLWVGSRMGAISSAPEGGTLIAPVGLATVLVGLLVIVSRRKAITQVIGYVVMENGIFVMGLGLIGGSSLLVEAGVLLDAFVAVFIMSIATWQISREFDHIDVDKLARLKG